MPRYFFEIADGPAVFGDDDGLELKNLSAMREEAIAILPEIAAGRLLDGDNHIFGVRVTDETDKLVFTATLTLNAQWHVAK